MPEKIEVMVKRKITVEEVDGGLYFVQFSSPDGKETSRKAATSPAALFKTLTEVLGLEKKKRAPNKPKKEKEDKK